MARDTTHRGPHKEGPVGRMGEYRFRNSFVHYFIIDFHTLFGANQIFLLLIEPKGTLKDGQ
jgi:hypothetical protein